MPVTLYSTLSINRLSCRHFALTRQIDAAKRQKSIASILF